MNESKKYYVFTPSSMPRIVFAHGYVTDHYDRTLTACSGIIEICYVEKGPNYEIFSDGSRERRELLDIYAIDHFRQRHFICEEGMHAHFTVGLYVPDQYQLLSKRELASVSLPEMSFIIPYHIAVSEGATEFHEPIKAIIDEAASLDRTRMLHCFEKLFRLLSLLTEFSLRQASLLPGKDFLHENIHCRRAKDYILHHIAEKMYVDEIAGAVGVSYRYLNELFAENEGMPIIDYVNRAKMNLVKELVTVRGMTVREAGQCIGISDQKYISRLFFKYNGITISEYKKMYNNDENLAHALR